MEYKLTLWASEIQKIYSGTTVVNDYVNEKQLFTLCSSNSTSAMAAYNPKLTEKVNGEKELSFTINYKYYDQKHEIYRDNPLLGLLVNGRTVKLEFNNHLYQFIITKSVKSSDGKSLTYTCTDANILELARNGYNIELDTELENNMGTVFDLADYILEDTNWNVVDTNPKALSDNTYIKSDLIKAYNTEPLYVYELVSDLHNVGVLDTSAPLITIPAGDIIYIAESSMNAQGTTIQFFWNSSEILTNEKREIINSPNYVAQTPFSWSAAPTIISASYRGKALVTAVQYKYIPKIEKTCILYKKDNIEYYGYDEPKFLNSVEIQNLLINNTNYTTLTGWSGAALTKYVENNVAYNALQLDFSSDNVKNTAITGSKSSFATLKGLNKDHKLMCAIRMANEPSPLNHELILRGKPNDCPLDTAYTNYYQGSFTNYATMSNTYSIDNSLVNYWFAELTYLPSAPLSYNDLLDSYIELKLNGTGSKIMLDIMLFPVSTIPNATGKPILIIPDLTQVENSVVTYTTYLFTKSQIDDEKIVSIDDLTYTWIGDKTKLPSGYIPQTNSNYQLITSIIGKESNRFNLLQDLCEKFQCWLNFHIDTDNTGRIGYKYQLTTDKVFQPGKQYYELTGTYEDKWFNDNAYHYANLNNYFTEATNQYIYANRDNYYRKSDDLYVQANLGHQWKEQGTDFYYVKYLTVSGVTQKTYVKVTASDTYSSTQDYYILENNKYVAVTVTDDFEQNRLKSLHKYYTMNYVNNIPQWKALYERHYEKYITFNEYTGNNNLAGFKYGINTKNISRTLDNEGLTTKLIVAMNNNECANGSYCTIAEAALNSSGSNTLYDFYYYIDQGIIDEDQYIADMYSTAPGDLGYIAKYSKWNQQNKYNTDTLASLTVLMSQLTSMQSLYANYLDQAQTDWNSYVNDIQTAAQEAGKTWSWEYCCTVTRSDNYNDKINEYIDKRDAMNVDIKRYSSLKTKYTGEIETHSTLYQNLLLEQTNDTIYKKALDKQFFEKYGKYIHEGTWSSEDYYNADTYYAAAQKVLLTSAYPKINYSFNVIDLSDLPGWTHYKFGIGDKTYIRDEEFFKDQGVASIEVIISSITWNLDKPQDTSIEITNYATSFEELFQRVAASVQSLQYNEAKYDKAAEATSETDEGTELLSRILSNNNAIVTTANGKFVYDETGITGTDVNPSYVVKMTTRGLVVSSDGGEHWQTGVSAQGINTQLLTAGTIDVNRINLFGGERNRTFSWDKYGLNAYTNSGMTGNESKYVRFDKYGIYGIIGEQYNWQPESISTLMNKALFALTWDGFALNANTGNNYVRISTNGGPSGSIGTLKKIIDAGTKSDSTYTSNFYVLEDGSMYANNGTFSGHVEATSGTFKGVLKAAELWFKDSSGNYQSVLENCKIKNNHLDLGGIDIDGNTPKMTIYSSSSKTGAYIRLQDGTLTLSSSDGNKQVVINNSGITISDYTAYGDDQVKSLLQSAYKIKQTNLNSARIQSPEIEGNQINVYGGTFQVYSNEQTEEHPEGEWVPCGWFGYATGSSGVVESTTTNGVAMTAAGINEIITDKTYKPYIIVTEEGIRLTAGPDEDHLGGILITKDGGIPRYKKKGGEWLEIGSGGGGTAVFG